MADHPPIDAVITWVDGSDPKLRDKQRRYFNPSAAGEVASETRFADRNEILYCLAGIFRNAPFINRVFIVTDDQRPKAIDEIARIFGKSVADRIHVIGHKTIFSDHSDLLPVFNSISIETMLHRIPGLSDRFIYFNDDFLIARPTQETDFFHGNRPVLRGKWALPLPVWLHQMRRAVQLRLFGPSRAKLFGFKECQRNAFVRLGQSWRYFWHDHTPHPFYRPTIAQYFVAHPQVLRANAAHRVRHFGQFDMMSLANGLAIAQGNPVIAPPRLCYMTPAGRRSELAYVDRKRREFDQNGDLFLCVQSLDQTEAATQAAIFAWLDALILQR